MWVATSVVVFILAFRIVVLSSDDIIAASIDKSTMELNDKELSNLSDGNCECKHDGVRQNIWIADSGASHHVVNNEVGLVNKRSMQESESVVVGDGQTVEVNYVADYMTEYTDEKDKKWNELKTKWSTPLPLNSKI